MSLDIIMKGLYLGTNAGPPSRVWSIKNHHNTPKRIREQVKTVLLCATRLRNTGSELSLPMEMWLTILEFPQWRRILVGPAQMKEIMDRAQTTPYRKFLDKMDDTGVQKIIDIGSYLVNVYTPTEIAEGFQSIMLQSSPSHS